MAYYMVREGVSLLFSKKTSNIRIKLGWQKEYGKRPLIL